MPVEFNLFLSVLGIGFILGIEHALDADHVAAIATIASKQKSIIKSSILGAFWGAGHTLTLFLVGLLVLGLKLTLPNVIALSFEFVVGIMLVLLGLNVLIEARKLHLKTSEHSHGTEKHEHVLYYEEKKVLPHTHKSFFVGMIHGLAGSAVLMLLVLSTLDSFVDGMLYIFVFGLGSIIGMILVGTLIGIPLKAASNVDKLGHTIRIIAGVVSVVLGFVIIYQIGLVEGLFSSLNTLLFP